MKIPATLPFKVMIVLGLCLGAACIAQGDWLWLPFIVGWTLGQNITAWLNHKMQTALRATIDTGSTLIDVQKKYIGVLKAEVERYEKSTSPPNSDS